MNILYKLCFEIPYFIYGTNIGNNFKFFMFLKRMFETHILFFRFDIFFKQRRTHFAQILIKCQYLNILLNIKLPLMKHKYNISIFILCRFCQSNIYTAYIHF